MQSRGTEVVRVANRAFLVGSGMQACGDTTRNAIDLEPGFYLALWPRRGGARVRYFGPFETRVDAQFLASSAIAMGLLEPRSAERESVAVGADSGSGQSICALTSV